MTTKRYDIRQFTAQIPIKRESDLDKLKPGCTYDDTEPELIESYRAEDEARAALARLESSVRITDSFYGGQIASVDEYGLEAVTVYLDEDGEEDYSEIDWVDFCGFPTEISWGKRDYTYNLRDGWVEVEEE